METGTVTTPEGRPEEKGPPPRGEEVQEGSRSDWKVETRNGEEERT